jgi:hypothetical protein
MKPKHNTLAYSRVPANNIIIYDIERGPGTEDYLRHLDRETEAARLGLEICPVFWTGSGANLNDVKEFLEFESILGGVKIEGVVIKNYALFGEDKKLLKAKYVSSDFQEKHQKEWKVSNPTSKDVVQTLIDELKTEARWRKSIQHAKEDNSFDRSPRDIGPLLKRIQEDIKKEEEDYIKEALFKHFAPQIFRGATAGFPQWFKEKLAEGDL